MDLSDEVSETLSVSGGEATAPPALTREMAEQDEAQFQADLKRALELSLETAVQEDARRDVTVGGSVSASGRSTHLSTFRYSWS